MAADLLNHCRMPDLNPTKVKVVVATTVMLSFIGPWHAAAVVLSDLASSAYYAGGIAESSVGKPAPWFVLAIMIFGLAIRAIYLESCSMFVRGGVYRVVQDALGGTLAKLSVSALMFDYILTGPISGVSAGLYLAGLFQDVASYFHQPLSIPSHDVAVGFALVVTVYFWFENTIGIRESSNKALRIIQVTTGMGIVLIVWCLLTAWRQGFQPVPLPTKANLHFSPDALGWLQGTALQSITAIVILVGLGHSLLAMSGFETLAQIYRELQAPKLKNLRLTSFVVILYSLLFTSSVSFFAIMLIPDTVRTKYLDNLIGGLAMYLAGPTTLKLLFHAVVVVVGALILSGAVNTSIVGANGVLNRVAEDGVLPDWFRNPHPKFGTTSRILTLIAILQIATILLSRGNVLILGEAYAFGVIWSFAMKALGVLVLRYKRTSARAWRVPLNPRIRGRELPLGLVLITVALFTLALINVFTKKTATISGSIFTLCFFLLFSWSERRSRARRQDVAEERDKFRLEERSQLAAEDLHVRPGNVLVSVNRPDQLDHLERVLEEVDPEKQDVVVVVLHHLAPAASGEHALDIDQICSERELELLTKIVKVAEKAGKHVELLVVPGTDASRVLVQAAKQLHSSRIVAGQRGRTRPEEQAQDLGRAWEQLTEPRPQLVVEILPGREGHPIIFPLGPHAPRLQPSDIDLVHHLWRELTEQHGFDSGFHHSDVVSIALRRLDQELHSPYAVHVLEELRHDLASSQSRASTRS